MIDPLSLRRVVDRFVSHLSVSDFLFTESAVRFAIETGELFQLLDRTESLKLDIYPRELLPGELSRSESIEFFPGNYLPVVSRIDAALSKLIWIDKGSHRSRRDFRNMFRNCSPMEQDAIRQSADSLGLAELIELVLQESDEIR